MNLLLTPYPGRAILSTLSQKTKAGLSLPRIGHKRPLSTVVFLYPSITQAALCRMYSVMVGCIEQPLKRLAGSYAGSENLIHSTAQRVSPMGGGYPLYIGFTAMNTPATNQANQGKKSLISLFSIYYSKTLVASNVPGTRALNLKQRNSSLIVKFDRMVGAA